MTPELVSSVAGVLWSVLFEYFPGLSRWYNAQTDNYQKLFMLGLLFLTVAGAYGLSCVNWLAVFACTQVGIKDAVFAFVLALVANQGTHRILPKKQ